MSTPTYNNHFYLYECDTTLPVFDEDGDLAQITVPFDMKASADRWHVPDMTYDYPFQECAFHEQIDFVCFSALAQLFQNIYGAGWGELGGSSRGDEPGTWIEPQGQLA